MLGTLSLSLWGSFHFLSISVFIFIFPLDFLGLLNAVGAGGWFGFFFLAFISAGGLKMQLRARIELFVYHAIIVRDTPPGTKFTRRENGLGIVKVGRQKSTS